MRFVPRSSLDTAQIVYLERQKVAIQRQPVGFDTATFWKSRRQTKIMNGIFGKLLTMAGKRERCMYCVDSKGTDIEHFYPKSKVPYQKIFEWSNYLLCCTECGRMKSDLFPAKADGSALLIDPTLENPWDYLDFDPKTGIITARFDARANTQFSQGVSTVNTLQLDRREALAEGYKKTWQRLIKKVVSFLEKPDNASEFIPKLLEADDHHLLGWCVHGTGDTEQPFTQLKQNHPDIWRTLCNHPEIPIPQKEVKL